MSPSWTFNNNEGSERQFRKLSGELKTQSISWQSEVELRKVPCKDFVPLLRSNIAAAWLKLHGAFTDAKPEIVDSDVLSIEK